MCWLDRTCDQENDTEQLVLRRSRKIPRFLLILCLAALVLAFADPTAAQPLPKVTIGLDKASSPEDVAVTLQLLFLFTVLTLAPAILIMTTSFTRLVIVFHFLRQALGLNQMPPNQLLIGLSLFLTLFIMRPVLDEMNTAGLQPYLEHKVTQKEAFDNALKPLRQFMLRHTREKDLGLFVQLSQAQRPESPDDVPTHVLIPSFIISELRTAFQIGFLLYIPFLMIDMIVASVLMSMGMLMLPPVMISLPFKVLLFVLVDGWHLLVGQLVQSFT
jgi:flagellar biosynthetic protein FliP